MDARAAVAAVGRGVTVAGVISGNSQDNRVGTRAMIAGDVNGDSVDDFIIVEGLDGTIGTMLIHGGGPPAQLTDDDVYYFGIGGFGCVDLGYSARLSLGDINADGLDDFAVFGDTSVRVVFGKVATNAANLGDIQMGVGGYEIDFADGYVFDNDVGRAADARHDFGGDGLLDLVFSAPWTEDEPQIVVVRGGLGPSATSFADLKAMGWIRTIHGECNLGRGLAFVPDLNQDQRAELWIGRPWGDMSAVYLVPGASEAGPMELPSLVESGRALRFVLDEPAELGEFVHVAELTGDGVADLIVGVPTASPQGRPNAGRVFVLSGAAIASLLP